MQQKIEDVSNRIKIQKTRLTKPLQIRDLNALELRLNEYIKFFNGEPNKLGISQPDNKSFYEFLIVVNIEKPLFAFEKMKIEIKCTKGKSIKKVTGVTPKCPSGYKKA